MSGAAPGERRRDWPWVAALVALAVLVRADDIAWAPALIDADSALGALMGRRIWLDGTRGYLPLMLDGQDYLGSLEAYGFAPFNAIASLVHAMALAETVQLAALIALLFPMLRGFAGREGAIAGCGLIAVGSPAATQFTTSAPMGYLSNMVLGLALIAVAHHWARSPLTPPRIGALAFLVGLGWWNNPQILPYVAAAAFALAPRTATVRAIARDGPRGAIRGSARRAAVGLVAVAGALLVATLALQAVGPQTWGAVSLEHPERYPPRALAALAAALLAADFAWADQRLRWLADLARGALFALLGAAPYVAYQMLYPQTGVVPELDFKLELFFSNFADIRRGMVEMMAGPAHLAVLTPLDPAFGVWRTYALAAFTGAFAAVVIAHARGVVDALRGRTARFPLAPVLMIPAVATMLLLQLRGGIQWTRYFIGLVPAAAAAVAWAYGALERRGRVAIGRAAVALLLAGYAVAQVDQAYALVRRPAVEDAVVARLVREGAVHGYGQYWVCYRFNAIADGATFLDCNYDGGVRGGNYNRWRDVRDAVEGHRGDLVRLYDFSRDHEDPDLLLEFLDTGDRSGWGRVRQRWGWAGGRYAALRYQRLPRPR